MYKRLAINLGKYLLAGSVLTYVVCANWGQSGSGGLKDVWEKHVLTGGAGVHWDYLLAGLVLYWIGFAITLIRWYLLVRAQDLPLTPLNAFRLGMIGCFFNVCLPGSVGGDIIKAAALAREQSRRTVAVATVLMDRIIGLWGLFWFVGLLGAAFWIGGQLEGEGADGRAKQVVVVTLTMLAASVAIWVAMGFLSNERAEAFALRLSRIPKVGGSAAEFWRAVWIYRCQPRCVLIAIGLSLVGFCLFVPSFYYSALALYSPEMGPMPTFYQHIVLVPIGLIVASVPGFPGGAGISELSFAKLYELFQGKGSIGILGSLVQRIFQWCTGLLGLVVYLVMPPAVVPKPVPVIAAPETELPQEDAATQVWLPAHAESTTAS